MKPAVGTEPWITRGLERLRKSGAVINQMRNGILLHCRCCKVHFYSEHDVGPEVFREIEKYVARPV